MANNEITVKVDVELLQYRDKKAVVLLSGGMDSTTCLYYMNNVLQMDVSALAVNYNQRHRKELEYAARIAEKQDIPFTIVDLSQAAALFAGSSQTSEDIDVPEGHYAEESMKQTVVPNRNMVLLSLAGAYAISQKASYIAYAAHAGDHDIYPDCREEFARTMDLALYLADWHKVSLYRPFIHWSKADIVNYGNSINVPFAETWSCYKGLDLHCGKCGTCVERREAFVLAGVDDPTEYADVDN